jgi:HAE1 family hydrophobic/amphiphilic exporter-1
VGPVAIQREDQSRQVVVQVNVSGRDMGSVEREVQAILAQTQMPSDVIVEIGGAAEDRREAFLYLGLAILAGVALVYMVMASEFESLMSPFIIMFTIPMSVIGVALALWLTGTTLDVMAMIGMLILVGIVVNNGIVLVDFMNQLRRDEGMDVFAAALEGGKTRLRPVLMTALTTILGMLPLAIGSGEAGETWAPLARSVMGGLTVATALTLILVPVIYTAFASIADRFTAFEDRRVAARNPELAAEIARERAEARHEHQQHG